jgi:NAD(P)-dependent dehydrogenase (short-subunit alcohol dehydrogenase family)
VQPNALANKCIVIIGGTSGLGLSAARACAAAGAKLIVVGRDDEHAQTARTSLGSNARVIVGEATVPQTSDDAIVAAIREFGRFDGLYHVAGGSGRAAGDGPLDQITDEGWDFTQKLNLNSLFYSNRAAVRQFLRQKTPGSVLSIGSVLGFSPSPKYFATHSYAAAKAAIIGLTKSAAAYYAPRGIRFNVIAPALVQTPMAQRAAHDPAIMKFITTKQPLDGGRIGQCSDLDVAVVFFLSDESKFVTGQVLAIDGGWSVSDGQIEENADD